LLSKSQKSGANSALSDSKTPSNPAQMTLPEVLQERHRPMPFRILSRIAQKKDRKNQKKDRKKTGRKTGKKGKKTDRTHLLREAIAEDFDLRFLIGFGEDCDEHVDEHEQDLFVSERSFLGSQRDLK